MITLAILGLYLAAAGVTAMLGEVRRTAWLLVATGGFVATSIYWQMGGPSPAFISAITDACVCFAIYAFCRYQWELGIWRMFQAFVLVHIIYLAGLYGLAPRTDFVAYSTVIEAINLLIIVAILGTGVMVRVSDDGRRYFTDRPIHRLMRFVRAERAKPPFWKAWS